jgi:hypothetical protein
MRDRKPGALWKVTRFGSCLYKMRPVGSWRFVLMNMSELGGVGVALSGSLVGMCLRNASAHIRLRSSCWDFRAGHISQ